MVLEDLVLQEQNNMSKATAKVIEVQQINEPLPGMEAFLGGFHTVAIGQKPTPTNSTSFLTIGIRRLGFPICYVNLNLDTNLSTGLTELVSMKSGIESQFNSISRLAGFSAKNGERKSAKVQVVNTEEVRDDLDDRVDSILKVVEE